MKVNPTHVTDQHCHPVRARVFPAKPWYVLKSHFKAFVRVMLRHRTESHILNSFVQTFIVLLVALVTFFFDLDDFSDRIMVNAVLLLAMATITSSIQEVRKNHETRAELE